MNYFYSALVLCISFSSAAKSHSYGSPTFSSYPYHNYHNKSGIYTLNPYQRQYTPSNPTIGTEFASVPVHVDNSDNTVATLESPLHYFGWDVPNYEELYPETTTAPSFDFEGDEEGSGEEEEEEESDTTETPTTTLAPFKMADVKVPAPFLRLEYMISFTFLGTLYGLGMLVLFQSLCVPAAKIAVVIVYSILLKLKHIEPVTLEAALEQLPPT